MGVVFAGVLAVMLAMNVFIFLALRGIAGRTGEELRHNAARQLAAYDGLLEGKSRELARLRARAGGYEKKAGAPPAAGEALREAFPLPAAAGYRGEELPGAYRLLREKFGFDAKAASEAAGKAAGKGLKACAGAGLLEELGFEARYRLATLPEEAQEEILREALGEEGAGELEEFLSEEPGFDLPRFLGWLEARARAGDPAVRVRGSDPGAPGYDPEICEGFQVSCGNRLYDYSIQKRELV